jgi:hypothetical protein
MDNEDLYFGAIPPVEVKATNCHTVNVHVHVTVDHRPPDTLRRLADAIEARVVNGMAEAIDRT